MLKMTLKKTATFVLTLCLIFISVHAQTAKDAPANSAGKIWEIPFASTGNTISLSVQNNSSIEVKNISVTFINPPSWLELKLNTVFIKNISANSSTDAEFVFSVNKKAPTEKDTTLSAVISTADGQKWTKEIRVSVGAPKDYKLYNNYPNPFNPSTKIAFELPGASHVKIVIYDVVGREVAQITDGEYPSGYSEVMWNGINGNGEHVSSGIYFYRISTGNWNKVMKMMVVK
ncbi:MAG: FlgD immunoglobulin-like domain containing protein [Ignavibacteriaceae bacterium]